MSCTAIAICSMKWTVPVCFKERLLSLVLEYCCLLLSGAEDSSQLTLISGGDDGSHLEGHCSKLSGSLSSKKEAIDRHGDAHWFVGLMDPTDES